MIAFQKACERLQDARTKAAIVKKNLVTKVPDGMTKWTEARSHSVVILNYCHCLVKGLWNNAVKEKVLYVTRLICMYIF